MEHWVLGRSTMPATIDHGASIGMIDAIGAPDRRTFARSVLAIARTRTQLRHCAVFAFEKHRNPELVSADSLSGSSVAENAALPYARHFFRKDEIQNIILRRSGHAPSESIVMHRQSQEDIADPEYRAACYCSINITERIANLIRVRHDAWVAVNLYRDSSDGSFTASDIEAIRDLSPLFAHAAARTYAIERDSRARPGQLAADELSHDGIGLTGREREVVLRILDGQTTKMIAAELRISPSTIVTYRERAYAKLGVSCRAELFAFVLRRRSPGRALS